MSLIRVLMMAWILNLKNRLPPNLRPLVEVGVLFLPAIPAYLWIWPNLSGKALDIFQVVVYLYILGGALFIGLRRWTWSQLGLNKKGLLLSLLSGLVLLAGRYLIIVSIDWSVHPEPLTTRRVIGDLFFYIGLVGLVEELMFRGLLYRLLEEWRGVRWAIWGSSFGFLLWHIFGQGPLIGVTTMIIGLVFALIRWRAGGILGLILVHGFWDLETVWLVASNNSTILSQGYPEIRSFALIYLGLALLVLVPVWLWFVHPRFIASNQ